MDISGNDFAEPAQVVGQGQILNIHSQARSIAASAPPLVVPQRQVQSDRLRGRTPLLESLCEWVAGSEAVHSPSVVVLHGLGGVGKTTLAMEFAWWFARRSRRVWWVPARNPSDLVAALHALAFDLGAHESEFDHAHPADVLWRHLARLEQPWLLAFDGVDDPSWLAPETGLIAAGTEWLRPPKFPGRVLVTSREGRSTSWAPWTALHEVTVLSTKDAAFALMDRAPNAGDQVTAEALAERLGGLPLALDLAGSYLAAAADAVFRDPGTPTTFVEYESALEDRVQFIDENARPDTDARRVMAQTWELSLDLLGSQGVQGARSMLRLLSWLAPSPVPYMRLLDVGVLDRSGLFEEDLAPRQLSDVLQGLAGLGLIRVDAYASERTIGLHPLLRETTLAGMNASDNHACFDVASELLDRATDDLASEDSQTWPTWTLLAPHCLRLLDGISRQVEDMELHAVTSTRPAQNLCGFLFRSGRWSECETTLRRVVEIRQDLLGDSVATASALRSLALFLGHRGRDDESEQVLVDAHAMLMRLLGPEHEATIDVQHLLAHAAHDKGRPEEAIALHQQVLAARTALLGDRDERVLTDRRCIANIHLTQGKFAEALREYDAILAIETDTLGEDSEEVFLTRHVRAHAFEGLGELAKAEDEHRYVFEGRQRVLGRQHVDAYKDADCWVDLLWKLDRGDEAERFLREVLAAQQQVLGKSHPSTLHTALRLAQLHIDAGRENEAVAELEALVEEQEAALGAADTQTCTTRWRLARLLRQWSDFPAAERELRRLIAVADGVRWGDLPVESIARRELASVLREQNRVSDAIAVLREELDQERARFGKDHALPRSTGATLAEFLEAGGDLSAAVNVYDDLLAIERMLAPGADRIIFQLQRKRAQALLALDETAAAISGLSDELADERRVLGDDHERVLVTRYQLACALAQGGDLVEAQQELLALLEDEQRLQGKEHPSTLVTHRRYAALLHEREMLVEATVQLEEIIEIQAGRPDENDQESVVESVLLLGHVLNDRGLHDEAHSRLSLVAESRHQIREWAPDLADALDAELVRASRGVRDTRRSDAPATTPPDQ